LIERDVSEVAREDGVVLSGGGWWDLAPPLQRWRDGVAE
jgi:hypothetical protein